MAAKKKKVTENSKEKSSKSDKMKRSQELALPHLAISSNYSKTCEELGLSQDTLYSWLHDDPEFKAQLDKMRSEACNRVFEEAIATLKNSTTKAVTTLVALLDRDDYPAVQRAAANDILTHVQKFKELQDFEDRIAKLEQRAVA